MVFVGPENSGQAEQIDRLAKGRNVVCLPLKGLRKPDAKRALKQVRLSAEANLLIIEDALPQHIMAILGEAISRLVSRRPPEFLYVIVTTTTLHHLERRDACSMRRIIPYLFPRTENDSAITFGWDNWPSLASANAQPSLIRPFRYGTDKH